MGKEKLGVPAALLSMSSVGLEDGERTKKNYGPPPKDKKTLQRRKRNKLSKASRKRNK